MFGTLINLLFLNNMIKGFYMKGIRALCLWFLLLPAGVASAQLVEKVLDIFNEDEIKKITVDYIALLYEGKNSMVLEDEEDDFYEEDE